MNVALILERMDPSLGGRESYTAELASALAQRHIGVTVICQAARWSGEGVRIVELGRRGSMRHQRLGNFVADAQAEAARGSFDVVHAMLPIGGADIYHAHGGTVAQQYLTSLRRRSPVARLAARMFRRLNLNRAVAWRLERQVARDGRICCLCVSHTVAREFSEHYGRSDNVRVIPNGVRTPSVSEPQRQVWRHQRRNELGIGDDELVFLSVAGNLELKGVPQAIEAFARRQNSCSEKSPARLVVVGSRDQRAIEKCKTLSERLGVGKNVRFVGPSQAIFEWYSAADALIQLSWYDSFGLAIAEAAAWGLPVITTALAGVAEFLDGAIVVNSPKDIDRCATALQELSNPEQRTARAAACRQAAQALGQDRHVDQIVELYQQIKAAKQA